MKNMKKALSLLFFMVMLNTSVCAQTIFKTKEVWKFNKAIEFGFQGTQIGRSSDGFSEWGMGIDITCYGFNLDYSFLINTHESDVRIDKWDDKRGWALHAGYQIPISKVVRIIPQIGYYRGQYGVTDGSNWKLTNSGIQNHFYSKERFSSFDYGAKIVINPAKYFVLFGQVTAHTFGIGIGYERPLYE